MIVLTFTSYKEYCELYSENHDRIAANCQKELARKDVILLLDTAFILYAAGLCTGVKNRRIKLTLSADTYSTEKCNIKICKAPRIKDLNLVIPNRYTFIASNSFFIFY